MTEENSVLFESVNNAGVAILNRPKSLNALSGSMVTELLPKLKEWERTKTCVIIKGAGDKAFCAGGDIKALREQRENNTQELRFAFIVYNVIYLIGNYKIPYIALINGIAFGGGLGMSIHGQYRVATENADVATPETLIGLFPDVGAAYFLPRLQNHIGFYMGLTGKRLKGKDVVISGLGTHYVPSARLKDLETQLTLCSNGAEIQRTLDSFSENPGKFSLAAYMEDINYCFSGSTVEKIIQRLAEVNNEWSKDTLEILSRMCPTSLKLTLRTLRRGRQLDLGRCLQMEYRGMKRLYVNYNFKEGVRARLIDKDNKPQWRPETLGEVAEEEVEAFLKRLPEDKELKFIMSHL